MRRLAAVALVAGFSALAAGIAVVATAETTANGLPAYTDGYRSWAKINKKPIVGGSSAHAGIKNVYRSTARVGTLFPNGTVIVKSIAQQGTGGLPAQVAVMRKSKGRWQWVEYTRTGSRYGILAQGTTCTSCHVQAKANDWVFTKR